MQRFFRNFARRPDGFLHAKFCRTATTQIKKSESRFAITGVTVLDGERLTIISLRTVTEHLHIDRADGTKVPAYVSASGPKAGLIVLQEWWGVNEQVKQTATEMAKECGVRVAVPDLYRSKIAYEVASLLPCTMLSRKPLLSSLKATMVGPGH